MTERGDQVQRLLSSLAKHADLVAEAFEGSVSGGDKARNAAIESLFTQGVLKPYDEDTYRLNPRLREFMADHFASYHAFQALRRVTGTQQQAREQWEELRRLHAAGAVRDAVRLHAALEDSIVDVAYAIEHNLAMLHALIATQYGNVDDLSSKLRQNRYYARQVATFLKDVQNIDVFVEKVAEEALAAGLLEVRLLVTRRLGAKRLQWTSQIKDAQSVISKRLFEAKLMEQRLRLLSRFALWLTRNRTADGWDLAVEPEDSDALFRPEGLQLRPQPDVADTDPAAWDGLLEAVKKLPAPRAEPPAPKEPTGPQWLIEEDTPAFTEPADPQRAALEDLVEHLSVGAGWVSLLDWKAEREELAGVSDEAWLMFAGLQLKGSGFGVRFVETRSLDAYPINELFHDIEAQLQMAEAA